MSQKRTFRSSQLISPFGVGAIVDLAGESLVNMDITKWPAGDCAVLAANNLSRVLGKEIRRPPTDEKIGAIPFTRFPKWLFCPSCRNLNHINITTDKVSYFDPPTCKNPKCKKTLLVPMRFVAVCSNGHLQDIDWHWWAHRNNQQAQDGQCGKQQSKLYFETTGASGGDFNAMKIRCSSCNSTNSFESLTSLPYPFGCNGKQPWQSSAEKCTEEARVHPRSASNVYYPTIFSSLDIDGSDNTEGEGDELMLREWSGKNKLAKG